MEYFENLTIKQKLILPSAAIVVGFFVILFTYQHGETLREESGKKAAQVEAFTQGVNVMTQHLLRLEGEEKDFLLDSNPKFVSTYAAEQEEARMLTARLESTAPDAGVLKKVQESKTVLSQYEESVGHVIASKLRLGLDENSGLRGEMRKTVHEVESALLQYKAIELENSMLMMRRHEKDFLARVDDKYVDKMAKEYKHFISLLKASALSVAEKKELSNKIKQYHQGFLALAEGVKEVKEESHHTGKMIELLDRSLIGLVDSADAILVDVRHKQTVEEGRTRNIFNGVMVIIGMILLLIAFMVNRMMGNLSDLIGKVQESSIQVASSVTEIASATREQEASATEHAATTSEVAASIKEIASTSKHLGQTTDEVAHLAQDTALSAADGQELLNRLDATMSRMSKASKGISDKLATLSEKAGNIGSMVTTINKVADQTNLLSLNAAIEAEKAGEYGRGFAVVATEIRRLADQTAVATYDIEQMVGEVQSAVSAGVMGMDKFSEEIHSSVEETNKAGGQLEKIIEQVQALAPHIESVNEGLQAQVEGSVQIDEAMMNLSEAAQQTAEIIRQSNNAISDLGEAAGRLQDGAALFKVKN